MLEERRLVVAGELAVEVDRRCILHRLLVHLHLDVGRRHHGPGQRHEGEPVRQHADPNAGERGLVGGRVEVERLQGADLVTRLVDDVTGAPVTEVLGGEPHRTVPFLQPAGRRPRRPPPPSTGVRRKSTRATTRSQNRPFTANPTTPSTTQRMISASTIPSTGGSFPATRPRHPYRCTATRLDGCGASAARRPPASASALAMEGS